jgi:PhnB protein
MTSNHRRPGFHTVTIGFNVQGSVAWLDFVKRAFGAAEKDVRRAADDSIAHGEILIGDSLVEASEARPEWPARPCGVHYYVPDADAVYAKALEAGGTSVTAPETASYGDRAATVQDPGGNYWFIATRLEGGPIPQGFHSLTPYVLSANAEQVIRFMQATFGAVEVMRAPRKDGTIMHSEHRIEDSIIELAEGQAPWNPRPCQLHVYLDDVDAAYARALASGATSLYAPTDQPYGDRECGVIDPGRNYWFMAMFTGSERRAGDPASSSHPQPA